MAKTQLVPSQEAKHDGNSPEATRGGSSVVLKSIRKSLGGSTIVHDLSLDIHPSEFLTLLGPSGCGKTTTLNMVAGFTTPDSGKIYLDGQDVTFDPPNERDSTMVFQQYALFPHLSIADNIAYGLKMRNTGAAEIRQRVTTALERVGLRGRESVYPKQLSGGQQQRVALARAIVVEPKVLLLDEPLSNLDLKLREQLRLEIKHLQRDLGLTTIFVTHDQTEALVMSDRIAVMREGRIEQLGTPDEIYANPANSFVAGFIGQSNLLTATLCEHTGADCAVELANGKRVQVRLSIGFDAPAMNTPVRVLFRPESLRILSDSESVTLRPVLEGTVVEVVNEGDNATVELRVFDGDAIRVRVSDPNSTRLPDVGSCVRVGVRDRAGIALPD